MLACHARHTLDALAHGLPVLAITRPRKPGKTTLARSALPQRPCFNLEDPDTRELALSDPRRFFARLTDGAVLDKVQRAPEPMAHRLGTADAAPPVGRWVLTGSQQFGLMDGIGQSTARQWLTLLQASHLATLLPPYHRNFGTRLVKTPKRYVLDSGLLCHLLRIASPDDLLHHAQRGAVFETWVVAVTLKHRFNRALAADLYFWRDNLGLEVDLVVEQGCQLQPVECKSGTTDGADWLGAALVPVPGCWCIGGGAAARLRWRAQPRSA